MAVGYLGGHFDGHIGFYDDQGTCKCSLLLHLFNRSRKHVRRQQKYNFIVIKMDIPTVLTCKSVIHGSDIGSHIGGHIGFRGHLNVGHKF